MIDVQVDDCVVTPRGTGFVIRTLQAPSPTTVLVFVHMDGFGSEEAWMFLSGEVTVIGR
jgi:mannose-6-phosphate isomerase-like protein (cupin superfamily)